MLNPETDGTDASASTLVFHKKEERMPAYDLTLEDAAGAPAEVNDEILAYMQEAWRRRRGVHGGSITEGDNGLRFNFGGDLAELVNAGLLVVVAEGQPGYDANKVTYLLEEIGRDNAGGIYNAMFSTERQGGRRRKTRKPKRKSKKTRRGISRR
jgi:hypothetical protein